MPTQSIDDIKKLKVVSDLKDTFCGHSIYRCFQNVHISHMRKHLFNRIKLKSIINIRIEYLLPDGIWTFQPDEKGIILALIHNFLVIFIS